MFPHPVELAFRRFQKHGDARALAIVFDRTAPELLRLARHLAVTPSDAEDLVQSTFVTAIEDAGSHQHGQRVLPWLLGILANHARASRRRARRQLDPDRLREPAFDASTEAEASELRSELREAIGGLPEVYRPVLRLVFEHGLQAAEIAQTLERPAGTVRAQVARGLELLRRKLPAGLAGGAVLAVGTGRGLAAVRQVVLSRCGATSTGFFSTLTILLMLQPKITAALGAVLLAALGFVWFDRSPPEPAHSESPAAGTVAASATPDAAPTMPANERTAAAAPSPAPAAPAAPVAATASDAAVLVVRVRDAAGQPVRGIGVAVFPFRDLQDFGRSLSHVQSDDAGEVRFAGLRAMQYAIDVDRVGMAAVVDTVAGEETARAVDLPAGVRIEGLVVDRRGAPVAHASIVLHGSRAGTTPVATADERGNFAVDHLTPRVELQARLPGREPSLAHTVTAATGSSQSLQLMLGDAARTLRGRVVDEAGQPAAGAIVAILPAAAAGAAVIDEGKAQVRAIWLHTDDAGAFVCNELGSAPQVVFTKPKALDLAPAWSTADLSFGDAVVTVTVPQAASVRGSVQRGGAPVAGLGVLAWPTEEPRIGYLLNLFGLRGTQTAADGTFLLRGLWAGEQRVRVMEGVAQLAERSIALGDGEQASWDLDLSAATTLRIHIESDAPLAPHRLFAMIMRSQIRNGEAPAIVPVRADGTAEHTVARTDDVDVVLTSMPGGRSLLQLAAVRGVPPGQDTVRIVLRASELPSRSIRGRLVDALRAPVAGTTVAAQRVDSSGLCVRCEAVTAKDGTFTVGPLPAGEYALLEGPLQSPHSIGNVVLTADRDELAGDLVAEPR